MELFHLLCTHAWSHRKSAWVWHLIELQVYLATIWIRQPPLVSKWEVNARVSNLWGIVRTCNIMIISLKISKTVNSMYHSPSSVFINNTTSDTKKHHKSTEPESCQMAKIIYWEVHWPHCFFTTLKSSWSRTMASFATPFLHLYACAWNEI